MGFRQAAVLCCTCFFLGVLSICLSVDYRLLYQELTKEAIDDGFLFYTTFFNAPPAIKGLLHGLVGFGVLAFVAKLYKWDDSAFFFDGTGLAAYICAIAVYASVTIPSLRTIVEPVKDVDSDDDRVEAMRVLAAGNTIMIILLGSIIVLQAGQEYAKRLEEKEMAKIVQAEKVKAVTAVVDGESKKDK